MTDSQPGLAACPKITGYRARLPTVAMRSPLEMFSRLRPPLYGRRPPLVLLNGLAEQYESWYRNRRFWSRWFEVLTPNILVYEGESLHERIRRRDF